MKKVLAILFIVVLAAPVHCCISDPTVTVIYDVAVDMDLVKLLRQQGFSYELYEDVIPSFGAEGKREFAVYKAHYGLATAMVAYDMVVLKVHEEHYDWEKGVKTELTFLWDIGVLGPCDINVISTVASWESMAGKNMFSVPEEVTSISVGNEVYPAAPVTTDYFSFLYGWIAVPGNATISVEGDTLRISLLRCGAEISADTSRLPVFAPFREVLLVCNSIDYEMAGDELKRVLTEKGYTVRRITPDEFDIYRWFSPKVILLGGHKSPEGMGEIVTTLLTEAEKTMIEKTGPYQFAHDNVDFKKQSMIFLAGKDREGTRDITLSRIEDIVMWLEYVP